MSHQGTRSDIVPGTTPQHNRSPIRARELTSTALQFVVIPHCHAPHTHSRPQEEDPNFCAQAWHVFTIITPQRCSLLLFRRATLPTQHFWAGVANMFFGPSLGPSSQFYHNMLLPLSRILHHSASPRAHSPSVDLHNLQHISC